MLNCMAKKNWITSVISHWRLWKSLKLKCEISNHQKVGGSTNNTGPLSKSQEACFPPRFLRLCNYYFILFTFHLVTFYFIYCIVLSLYFLLNVTYFMNVHFYRAMHFSAKRGIAIACRLSDRPSVRPSVCDVGKLWSHRLEFFKNNFTIS